MYLPSLSFEVQITHLHHMNPLYQGVRWVNYYLCRANRLCFQKLFSPIGRQHCVSLLGASVIQLSFHI